MNKKFIAVFCILILMVSVFSACGNKGYLLAKDENGVEHAYVTDENGETVLNEDGNIRVYETDAHGKIVKDENGNKKENSVKKPEFSINKNGSVTNGIFTLYPVDGWEASNKGTLVKKGTDEHCYIMAEYLTSETEEKPFSLVIDEIISENKPLADSINDGDYKDNGIVKAEMNTNRFEYQGKEAVFMSFTIFDTADKVIHHAETIHFINGEGEIYAITYGCLNGEGYDSSFNFLDWANNNFEIK